MSTMDTILSDLGGRSVSRMDDMLDRGYAPVREAAGAAAVRQFEAEMKAKRIFEMCKRRPGGRHLLREAFSTSDFPLAFSWYTARRMLAEYANVPASWARFLARAVVPDFRPMAQDRLQGLNSPLANVKPGQDYPDDQALGPGSRDISLVVNKLGRIFGITWESQVNDVLGQLDALPKRLAEAAARTEMITATQAYASGTNQAAIYQSRTIAGKAYNNSGTAALSLQAIMDGITFMRGLVDDNGNPIFTGEKLVLVVPPALEIKAKSILGANGFVFDTNPAAGTQKQRLNTENFIGPMVEQATDYYLPIVDTSHGNTGWYLFAQPDVFPAGNVAFLEGEEKPALFRRLPDAERITDSGEGGAVNPLDGSFSNDVTGYKIRHEVGASINEWRATYYSNGTA